MPPFCGVNKKDPKRYPAVVKTEDLCIKYLPHLKEKNTHFFIFKCHFVFVYVNNNSG